MSSKTFKSALCVFTFALAIHAQSFYGSVRGTLFDQNGGVMASGKITLTNTGTADQRSTVASGAGEFVFNEVVPGTYSLAAESPGFKRFERKGITVGTQQQVSFEVKLEIGQVSESVQVTEEVPLVESANAVRSTNWTQLQPSVRFSTNSLTVTNSFGPGRQKFYRARLVP